MTSRIDHFMYAVPSLEEGMEWAGDTFGVAPAYGGEHVGLGTRNALLSLGSAYLEIIAPDPAQRLDNTTGAGFAAMSEGALVTWAVEGNLADIASALAGCGVKTAGPNRTQRKTGEGDLLVWELLFPRDSEHGPRMPFFIDWLDCANPKDTNPPAGDFHTLQITTPGATDLQQVLTAIDLDVTVFEGEPLLTVSIETRGGEVVLASSAETSGLSFG